MTAGTARQIISRSHSTSPGPEAKETTTAPMTAIVGRASQIRYRLTKMPSSSVVFWPASGSISAGGSFAVAGSFAVVG